MDNTTKHEPNPEIAPETQGDQPKGKPVEPMRDAVSGLTLAQSRAFDEFIYGSDYDSDPERRWTRAHGGHCSGGGGPC